MLGDKPLLPTFFSSFSFSFSLFKSVTFVHKTLSFPFIRASLLTSFFSLTVCNTLGRSFGCELFFQSFSFLLPSFNPVLHVRLHPFLTYRFPFLPFFSVLIPFKNVSRSPFCRQVGSFFFSLTLGFFGLIGFHVNSFDSPFPPFRVLSTKPPFVPPQYVFFPFVVFFRHC